MRSVLHPVAAALQHKEGNRFCKDAGIAARARFNAVGYGFRQGNNSNPLRVMYVEMTPDVDLVQWFGGFAPIDGNVYVNDNAWLRDTEMLAGVIAHEEEHQKGNDGPFHNTGTAYFLQAECGQQSPT